MSYFKITTAALTVAMFATAAGAGSLVEPMEEPMIEAVEEDDDSGGLLLPLAALVLIGVAVGGSSNSGTVVD